MAVNVALADEVTGGSTIHQNSCPEFSFGETVPVLLCSTLEHCLIEHCLWRCVFEIGFVNNVELASMELVASGDGDRVDSPFAIHHFQHAEGDGDVI